MTGRVSRTRCAALGTVASDVVRRAACEVLIVRPAVGDGTVESGVAGDAIPLDATLTLTPSPSP
ncbi:MAG: hypothetical protein ACXVXW_12680 [Mycobacteriaceae bacterium]